MLTALMTGIDGKWRPSAWRSHPMIASTNHSNANRNVAAGLPDNSPNEASDARNMLPSRLLEFAPRSGSISQPLPNSSVNCSAVFRVTSKEVTRKWPMRRQRSCRPRFSDNIRSSVLPFENTRLRNSLSHRCFVFNFVWGTLQENSQ